MKEATHISGKAGTSKAKRLQEIAASSLKLGTIGFGGIAGMVATIENEMVVRRKWIDHQHFMDVLSTSYIIPGPNAVEVVMHCGKERGGRLGLIVAGVCYILPAMIICLVLGHFYQKYNALPEVQDFMFGLRPAITALVFATVFRLSNKTLKNNNLLILLCLVVLAGSLYGLNEILLIISAGAIYYAVHRVKRNQNNLAGITFIPFFLQVSPAFSESRFFLIFLKIGAVLYGSGFVLFAYMDESLVRHYHWLNRQQLTDAIAVGQITPGPILSSATFAGYLIGGISGGVIATIGIFLPSFSFHFSFITSSRGHGKVKTCDCSWMVLMLHQ